MNLHDPFYDGEAHPGSLASFVEFFEEAHHLLKVRGFDAFAVVLNEEDRPSIRGRGTGADDDLP